MQKREVISLDTYPTIGLGININVGVHDLGQSVAISTG